MFGDISRKVGTLKHNFDSYPGFMLLWAIISSRSDLVEKWKDELGDIIIMLSVLFKCISSYSFYNVG